jgi:hypothetical protein
MRRCFSLIAIIFVLATAASAQTYRKTKIIDPKGKEVPVEISFSQEKQMLSVEAAGKMIEEVPYATIGNLSYERAARRRVKEGAVVMIASLGVGAVVMLTKSKNHWFYVDHQPPNEKSETLTLKLDKGEYESVLKTAADQTGKQVEMLSPAKDDSKKK